MNTGTLVHMLTLKLEEQELLLLTLAVQPVRRLSVLTVAVNVWAVTVLVVVNMKKSNNVAIAGICSALSIIAIVLSQYIEIATLVFMAICVFILVYLLDHNLIFASILCYISSSILSILLGSFLASIPYIFFFGGYTILAFFLDKIPKKLIILIYFIKVIFWNVLLYVGIFVATFITNPNMMDWITGNTLNYIILAVLTTIIFIGYDFVLKYYVYPNIRMITDRITRKK